MMKVEKVLSSVRALVEPALDDMGKELVHVEYVREHGSWVLRLYVERRRAAGITVDELAQVSRDVGAMLDVEDIIVGSYRLEVSSPGLDRPLGKIGDCDRFAGRKVLVVTREPFEGRRRFSGVLRGTARGAVVVEDDSGEIHEIPWVMVKKANLKDELAVGEKQNA